jgi:hypothetical protein
MTPVGQVKVDASLQPRQVPLLQQRDLRMLQPVRSHPVQRGTAPQRQRGDQPVVLGRRVWRGRRLVQEPGEPQRIHPIRLDVEHVPAAPGDDQVGAEHAAEPFHVGLDIGPSVAWRILAPHRDRQPVHRYRLARPQRQRRQQRAQPTDWQLHWLSGNRHLQRPQQPDRYDPARLRRDRSHRSHRHWIFRRRPPA